MIQFHTVAATGLALADRVTAQKAAVANGSGAAGATVTVAVTFAEPMPDAAYAVEFDAGQDVVCFATAKTAFGFTLNINPRLAANSVAAGNVTYIAID